MEEIKDAKRLIAVTLFVISLLLTLVYMTYSLNQGFRQKEVVANIIKIDEEAYGETEFSNNNLELKPILDKDVKKDSNNLIYIEFNIGGAEENDRDDVIYDIALADLEIDCELLSPYVKWKLIKNGLELSTGSLDYKFDTIKDNRLVLNNIQQDLVPFNTDKTKYDHYEFYMWISDSCQEDNISNCKDIESQKNLLNKQIKGKIEVELYTGIKIELERNPQEILDINTCIK